MNYADDEQQDAAWASVSSFLHQHHFIIIIKECLYNSSHLTSFHLNRVRRDGELNERGLNVVIRPSGSNAHCDK